MSLLIICAALACILWLIAFPQYILCEVFELNDKGAAGGVKIRKRKRRVLLLKELPLFLFCRLPDSLRRKIKKIFSSGMTCCYQLPHYSDMVGGKIPAWFHVGSTAQLTLYFPWKKPLHSEDKECGSVSSFIYCNHASCPSLEIEIEAEGLRIDGERRQMYELSALPAVYRWNFSADKAGTFIVKIIAKLHTSPDAEPIYAVAAQRIRVLRLPFLSIVNLFFS
ncbi:MAG: hypothetical protein ACTFAL_01830 [Candidatus Electronema sp. V4]|uniref:hypothetical protein n=1 Tax=Candidatus Electronema sp. V4 TaxID=3454756 RepID=UPI0040555028